MEDYKYCEECLKNDIWKPAELHHIILKSKAKYMSNIKINFKYLCPEHHRLGKNSPHMNREVDLRYKLQLQKDMFSLFEDKEYWTEREIRDKLQTTNSEAKKITKKLLLHKEGYKALDIVIRLMGGMLYVK